MNPSRVAKRSRIHASPEAVFAFHQRPDALKLLLPAFPPVTLLASDGSLEVGSRAVLRLGWGPIGVTWIAEHTEFTPGRSFTDRQIQGPFAFWEHHHRVEPAEGGAWLVDEVEYCLPGGWLGNRMGGWLVRRMLTGMVERRHEVTRRCCDAEASPR